MLIMKSQQLNDHELLEFATTFSSVQKGSLTEKILHWEFGPIMNMHYDINSKNYLFSEEKVPLHWDGAFYRVPRLLLFYCTETHGDGGETLFSDTESLWESLSEAQKKECQQVTLCYQTEKVAHYGGQIHIPLIQSHPTSGKTILRLAEKVETQKNPVTLTIHGTHNPTRFYEDYVKLLYSPKFMYTHKWEKGDLLIVDNYKYLHGRNSLGNNKMRSFKRIQIL